MNQGQTEDEKTRVICVNCCPEMLGYSSAGRLVWVWINPVRSDSQTHFEFGLKGKRCWLEYCPFCGKKMPRLADPFYYSPGEGHTVWRSSTAPGFTIRFLGQEEE